jgi:DNA-directed RNA polymerase specialized sigma24 family protein
MQDAELLREYVTSGSDVAFAELVDRYVDFVYSTARRQLGNAQLAEEVAQAVFSLTGLHALPPRRLCERKNAGAITNRRRPP